MFILHVWISLFVLRRFFLFSSTRFNCVHLLHCCTFVNSHEIMVYLIYAHLCTPTLKDTRAHRLIFANRTAIVWLLIFHSLLAFFLTSSRCRLVWYAYVLNASERGHKSDEKMWKKRRMEIAPWEKYNKNKAAKINKRNKKVQRKDEKRQLMSESK